MNVIMSWIILIIVVGWFLLAFLGVVIFTNEIIQKRRFYNAVRETVYAEPFILKQCTESIKNSYEVYRRYYYFTPCEPIINICQEFAVNIRLGKALDCYQLNHKNELADRVEFVINQLREEQQFDDEKASEIVMELSGIISSETLEEIKRKLTFLEAYHKGVISVKNAEINEIRNRMKTKKWISLITGALGVIGSIASVVSLFLAK